MLLFSTSSYILVHSDGLSSGQLTQLKFSTPLATAFGPCSCGPKQTNQTSLFFVFVFSFSFFCPKTWLAKKSFLPVVRELGRYEPGNCKEPSKGENEAASRDTQRHRGEKESCCTQISRLTTSSVPLAVRLHLSLPPSSFEASSRCVSAM